MPTQAEQPERGRIAEAPRSLIARASWGDTDALEQLLRHYDPSMRLLAYRLVGQSMSDVLQDAYIKAYRALPDFRLDQGTFGGWLARIVYTSAIDHLRRERRHRRDVEAAARDEGGATPEERLLERLDFDIALHALPLDQRAAVILVDGLGFSYDDAAMMLELARGTLASRLHTARKALRATLKGERPGQAP